ncbi:hypothetical protein BsWGS_05297 [Bradybaena similaris]
MSLLQLNMLSRLRLDCLIRQQSRATKHFSYVACPHADQFSQQVPVLYKSACTDKDRICCVSNKLLHGSTEFFHSMASCWSRESNAPALKPSDITDTEYEICVEDTLDSLTEYFEDLPEIESCSDDYDCAYGNGVLTIHLGSIEGTYVINKQMPNKQIWLSSPLSGPRRYDYFDGQWVYLRDGRGLHRLLEDELTEIMGFNIELKKCKYYSWGMPDSK